MHQILFRIPAFHLGHHFFSGFDVYTYGVMLAIAFMVGLTIALQRAKSQGISAELITDLSITLLVAGVIGSRLLFVLEDWSDFASTPWSIFNIREGGLSIHGGLILGFLAGWWFTRRHKLDFWKLADVMAPAIAIGMGIGRIGCFFNGCCLGISTSLPWGVVFKDNPDYFGPRHPTQLYEMFLDFLIAIILMVGFRSSKRGRAFLSLCMMVGISRFLIEFLRADAIPVGPLSLIQWVSLGIIAISGVLLLKLNTTEAPAAHTRRNGDVYNFLL